MSHINNSFYNANREGTPKASYHAEELCVRKYYTCGRKRRDIELYLIRVDKNGNIKRSEPCKFCSKLLQRRGIRVKVINEE